MKTVLIRFFVLALTTLIFSCSSEYDTGDPVGDKWVTSGTRVYFIDTLTVQSATFKFDSINVSSSERLLLGSYKDSVFGRTQSELYIQLQNYDYYLDDDAIYDSIALILNYDGYYYNDTIASQQYQVHRIVEDIKPGDDDYYYNTSSFKTASETIGDFTFKPKPIKEDSIHLKLHDDFGATLFESILDNDINNIDEFLKEYKGINITPDNENTAMLGFETTGTLRLYYTIPGETDTESTLDFSFNSTNTFHHITSETGATYFSTLTNQEELLPSTTTGETSFIQSGTGIATRIAFPYLEKIYDINGKGSIIEAHLKISLKNKSSSDFLKTRDSIQVYLIDQKSQVLSSVTTYGGDAVIGELETTDDEFYKYTYSIPLDSFITNKLEEYNGDNWFLAIYSNDYRASVDRYIFYDQHAADDIRLKLELTYAVYDE